MRGSPWEFSGASSSASGASLELGLEALLTLIASTLSQLPPWRLSHTGVALKQPWIGGPAIENRSIVSHGGRRRKISVAVGSPVGGRENTSVASSHARNKRQTDRQREQGEITKKAWGNRLPPSNY